jgi:hypothetical protein
MTEPGSPACFSLRLEIHVEQFEPGRRWLGANWASAIGDPKVIDDADLSSDDGRDRAGSRSAVP